MWPAVLAVAMGWGAAQAPPPYFITGYQRLQAHEASMKIPGSITQPNTALFRIDPRS